MIQADLICVYQGVAALKKPVSAVLAVFIAANCALFAFAQGDNGYVVVTDYVTLDGTDVADAIQAVIDSNPNRTIFFSDGNTLFQNRLERLQTREKALTFSFQTMPSSKRLKALKAMHLLCSAARAASII